MLHTEAMPRGKSGRIVLEINPHEKEELYEAIQKDGLTLKDWFLNQARYYLRNRNQADMFLSVAEGQHPFGRSREAGN